LPNGIDCFSLSRKLKLVKKRTKYLPKRIICKIEKLNEMVEMQCITINSPDRLFLVNEFIVTHNTFLAMAFAINEVLQGTKKKIILTRPIVEAGEHLGFLPGDFNEKVHPYMVPLYDCISKLVGVDNIQREMIDNSIEVAPLAYLRGRTLDDAVCILDEAQNATLSQMKLFLTRLGENSKMIVNGDPTQSDLNIRPVSLSVIIKKLQNVPGIGIINFGTECIVRHPLVGAILKELESKENVD
jgi:phosphate starvation-inducible PhoH-like protein